MLVNMKVDLEDCWICLICHNMLLKIEKFKQSVENTVKFSNEEEPVLNKLSRSPINLTWTSTANVLEYDVITPNNQKDDDNVNEKIKIEIELDDTHLTDTIETSKTIQDDTSFSGKVQQVAVQLEDVKKEREEERNSQNFTILPFKCYDCLVGFNFEDGLTDHFNRKHKMKTDEDNQLSEESTQQKKLPNARRKKKRKKMEEDELSEERIRRRQLTNARVQKYRKRKQEALKKLEAETKKAKAEIKAKQIEDNDKQRKALARERSRRYREKKRINILKSVGHFIHDSQIPGSSHVDPLLVVTNDDPENVAIDKKGTALSQVQQSAKQANKTDSEAIRKCNKQSRKMGKVDKVPQLSSHARAFLVPNPQHNRSTAIYSSYTRQSSAHIQFYKQFIQNSFGHPCEMCDRLHFSNELKHLNDDGMDFVKTFLPTESETMATCYTCRASIYKGQIPKMSVYNGFKYPAIPDNLLNHPLDLVSERLISPKIPFMQIRRLRHVPGQKRIYGQAINVPLEENTMVNKLPRNMNDDFSINIDIKRKKIYKSSDIHGLINKNTIKQWLEYLGNTPLYRKYKIVIDKTFFGVVNGEEVSLDEQRLDENDLLEDIPIKESLLTQQQTVLWKDDLYLRILSGESNFSNSVLDVHAEELLFPSIYLGHIRKSREGIIMTPFMLATSEIRRSDRRGATPQHLLYMAIKIMKLRVRNYLIEAFRHVAKKSEEKPEDYINNYIESNLASLRTIPNSTWYWSEMKKDLLAMIRQLGRPTVFFTISANEIGWLDLLQLLYKLNKGEHVTKDVISELDFMVKSTLINEDAVTCAIFFNKLVSVVLSIIQSQTCSPFRKYRVLHYFKHIEFRNRDSPCAHILAWIDNSPKDFLGHDYDKAIELIDTLTSLAAVESSGNIKLQIHSHTDACYNKADTSNKSQKCRFGAPFMPCKNTMILTPKHEEDLDNVNRKRFDDIQAQLGYEDFEDINDFYKRNGIKSDEDYCDILRSGIDRPKVFLKRDPSEKWHSPFNPFILNIVQSNTEFQFITDDNSCAAFIEEYFDKSNRELSDLRLQIMEAMHDNPELDIIDVTNNISINMQNYTEITSSEAAWYLLREPTSKSSFIIEYIPTVRPIERIKKTLKASGDLDDDSTDIGKESNWFDKYVKRPEHLESITLAQLVSKYTVSKKGEYFKRREDVILRYRNYDPVTEVNEYKREMVTLHIPFRNEEEEIIQDMRFITIFDNNEDTILHRRKEFEAKLNK
ncbi:uncharacterized protein LOC126971336 isoform X2 [Leptidea sinapis]|nr:uncharacterized protein LOC126971336 isoform X2 [Leptidea sinapis]